MRSLRGALVVLLLLMSDGDGARRPPVPGFMPWTPTQNFRLPEIPTPPSMRLWVALWADGWGETRRQLTVPASPRLEAVYRDVLERAAPWKFGVRPPELRETASFVPLFIPNQPAVLYARYFQGPNRILVDSSNTAVMTDAELRVLLSHELGHAVDAQTERVGHWSFPDVYWMNEQQFADHIARLLTSNEEVKAFNERYVYPGRAVLR